MKNIVIFAALLALSPLAASQTSAPGAGRGTPEMRARMQQLQPVMDLAETVQTLPDLEKNKATALTKTQAKSMLTLLTTLQKATTIKATDAKKYLTQIEDKILSDKQLTALDTLMLNAEKQREAQRAKRQASRGNGARVPGMPALPGAGAPRPAGQPQGGQNAQRQPIDPNKYNPFKQGRSAEALKSYMALLKKK